MFQGHVARNENGNGTGQGEQWGEQAGQPTPGAVSAVTWCSGHIAA